MSWFLIIHHGDAVHCWDIGDHPPTPEGEAERDELIMRARHSVGFPVGDRWAHEGNPRVQVMLTQGEPHPTLLARATVHRLSDLDRVDASAYRAQCNERRRAALLDAAEAAILTLPATEQAALRSRLGWTGAPKPTGGSSRG